MSLFGELQVRLDPWQVDYGTELPLEDVEADHPDEAVVLDIELAAGEWRPVTPGKTHAPSRLVFVDGVRRLEARLIIRRGERLCHGAFGSYAVGAVGVADGVATCLTPRVGHVVVVGSGESLLGSITVAPGLSYRPVSTLDSDADAPLRAIQERMRLAEERLGKELAGTNDTLVIVDGPLTFEEPLRGAAVGYIKRIFKLYVPREHLGLLARLSVGQRTPLFALRSSRRFVRFSWFVRLAQAALGDSELAGIARLEVSETVGVDTAQRLADATAALLPRFVPRRWRDPRSPQNLLPIGAIEASLRRHLGDARLIRRYIESLIAMEARGG
jgi:hypothetical protein